MTKRYGTPYQGSKQAIADDIIAQLPGAENFYDPFAGGGAISHAAALSGKYKNIYMSDVSNSVRLFEKAAQGAYDYEVFQPEFIDRAEFKRSKDPYVKYIWSFGSNGQGYMMRDVDEPIARLTHDVIVFGRGTDELIRELKVMGLYDKKGFDLFRQVEGIKRRRAAWSKYTRDVKAPEKIRRLEWLERLERLQGLVSVPDNIYISQESYHTLKIKPDSVVYCDIPYNTKGSARSYTGDFDHRMFWLWVSRVRHPLYVSEYAAPSFMQEVWSKEKLSLMTLNKGKRIVSTEKLFWNGI